MMRQLHNERGVALLIALLVTVLLIALVFEFAYATRVSLRAAANLRDSERAYFLARSGVNFVGKILSKNLQDSKKAQQNHKKYENLQQADWYVVPIPAGGDAELRVRWEDESGKINISAYNWIGSLFDVVSINHEVLERIKERVRERGQFALLSELHQVMSDEEYEKVKDFITMRSDWTDKVSINSAPVEVLRSILRLPPLNTEGSADRIVSARSSGPIADSTELARIVGDEAKSVFDVYTGVSSRIFKVHSRAVVGEYVKVIEAIIQRSDTGFTILSWRSL